MSPAGGTVSDAQVLLDMVWQGYGPNQVVAWRSAEAPTVVPLSEGREAREVRATAYVCEHFSCELPVTEPEALATTAGLNLLAS